MKTKLELARERWAEEHRQIQLQGGIKWTKLDLGPGPAYDYNKGPGNWTGD